MIKDRKIVILGGGTFNPIRNHLSLAAPAFGSTAKYLHSKIEGAELILTKMANPSSWYKSNEDVSILVDELISDDRVKTIIFNVALCDYEGEVGSVKSSFHAERLETKKGATTLRITPAEKLIGKIRRERPDIFLVGFKTTTNKTEEEQFLIALKMMKKTKCNLVLANDTTKRYNMIITPEETTYGNSTDRNKVLDELAEMIQLRQNLTYNRTDFSKGESVSIKDNTPENFQEVLQFVVDNGGYLENNGNGFTPGHFCFKNSKNSFLSSQRKADHNKVFYEGLTEVKVEGEKFSALGARKPSVGARSQWLLLERNPEYDCIIHTHNPQKKGSKVPVVEQRPYQCGSLECGINTRDNMKDFDGIKAVFLDKHGINILFKSTEDPSKVIEFIKNNIVLGKKLGHRK